MGYHFLPASLRVVQSRKIAVFAMELKEYQSRTLGAFSRWLKALETARQECAAAVEALQNAQLDVPGEIRNYPANAWQRLAAAGGVAEGAGHYTDRTADAGFPIPHVCFKVPTGGGKTLLAAAALERLNRPTGLTIWITPTRAIYQQTRIALRNRQHPYRNFLERGSGGRVKLLEKDDPFTAGDIANYLCVMLLMLPAANRQTGKEFLRMFRDSGRYPTLFPDSDDLLGDGRLLQRFPDLECTTTGGSVKHSLFNVLKMWRPVVVLDEAHRAYGRAEAAREFVRSINRINPSLVIELSATPNRTISNLLVDISGVDLKNEEMIKLPVRVESFTNAEWQLTLVEAAEELKRLEDESRSLQMSGGPYIRPIAVVRVERTGKGQRDGERIHAEDVREYLERNLGVDSTAVRVKSSENDEIGREDLLSKYSRVTWIITRAALMEGWDCSFAYVLVMLDNTSAQRAITQLVGRVMRQPYARRTGRAPLDQCYVYCWNTEVAASVQQVKNGLEQEGFTGLGNEVWGTGGSLRLLEVQRREKFRSADIFLPKVLHREGAHWRDLDYQRDILPAIDWGAIEPPDPQHSMPIVPKRETASVDIGDVRPIRYESSKYLDIDKTVGLSYFARRLSDVVPNPWQAARISAELINRLQDDGEEESDIYDRRSYLAYALRESTINAVERFAERVFHDKLAMGDIRFDLEADVPHYRMRQKYQIPVLESDASLQRLGQPMQLNLFDPIFERQFDSELEKRFAYYLDEQKALRWWHRVAVRQQGEYHLRGWRRERIYPDFIAMAGETAGNPHLLVFETKGEHLRDNPETEYKRKVLDTLQSTFNAGKMHVCDGPAKGTFRLIFHETEFPTALNRIRSYTA